MGGPLIVIPVSAVDGWRGCTQEGMVLSTGGTPDDYDRACAVEGLAGEIRVGPGGARGLVLADEPAATCYLPQQRNFVRWLAADAEADLLAAADAVLADPATAWEDCGTWQTDGPAVLMDSADAGGDLDMEYPNGGGLPDQAPVAIPAGRWRVRAYHATAEFPWVGVVQLVPECAASAEANTEACQ